MKPKVDRTRRRILGARLRAYRKEQGLTQGKLGKMAGSDHNYIYELEKGKKSPTVDMLCRLADALGIQVRDLIEF